MMLKWLWLAVAVTGCGFGDNQGRGVPAVDGGVLPVEDAMADAAPDAATDAPVTACTLVPQSGCSGATPACDTDGAGGTTCRAVTAQGTSNNHCSEDTACKAGYSCIGTDDADEDPWCGRLCNDDDDCTGTGSRCTLNIVDSNNQPLNMTVCSNACNIVTQSGCPADMGCIGRNDGANDYTDCRYMAGTVADGGTCTSTLDCHEGSACVSVNGALSCHRYCAVGDNSPCAGDDTCRGFGGDNLMIGGVTYGVCL